jgi:hypothetical protein
LNGRQAPNSLLTRDITAVAILKAEETRTTRICAEVTTGAILSAVAENGSASSKVDEVAVL